MIINKIKLIQHIDQNIQDYDSQLSLRVRHLLNEIKEVSADEQGNIELFELLVNFIYMTDQSPAEIISNLLIPINPECSYLLDKGTITEAAAFLRDFLKKDFVLDNLNAP